ncbi:hypothetical protein [Paenibacillus eucommiae]|uniref:Alpha-L-rhamnosidase six-hairpin glycosidase domain-containing protein n=1 Tax=Paenibacillus eucommiae TaxID=1355755 RepID=A0ABS4J1B3_9BACL|nr:hypothetical protein [Paenibacillus eucommiae]MBP1993620.1 hypothetical protein [Paenibacillus eucommiae]
MVIKSVKQVAILWHEGPAAGTIQVKNGTVTHGSFTGAGEDRGEYKDGSFQIKEAPSARLELTVDGSLQTGSGSVIVSVLSGVNAFSFFLRDVSAANPICIPDYGVAVTEAGDPRSYEQITGSIRSRSLLTDIQRLSIEPEESFEAAAAYTKDMKFQTWLGLSRDMRIFAVDFHEAYGSVLFDYVEPRFHLPAVTLPETDNAPVRYSFRIGRGVANRPIIKKRLEDGVLPILHGVVEDGDIIYNTTTFVSLERNELTKDNVRGTHFLVADGHTSGQMFTESQKQEYDRLLPEELSQEEETVLYYRIEAINTASVPRYCWFFAPLPNGRSCPTNEVNTLSYDFDPETGFGVYASGRVYGIVTVNGEPLRDNEMAVLVNPGETAKFDIIIPHRPISRERAAALAEHDFTERHEQCRTYWQEKLAQGSRLQLPERRIDEMVRAGLLHLDLVTYGLEPDDAIAPTIGIYAPIGSESAPITQFMDSMGWHDTARRSIMYFLEKQHDSGFIQNFQEYMLETGCVLWTIGEHYRYTRNEAWISEVKPKIVKACQYILDWRQRNMTEELRGQGKGFGLLDGKTADPEDPFRSFMLNGYAYLGLKRIAEVFTDSDPDYAAFITREAEAFKQDIRTCFYDNLALSPVVPLGDGTWSPTASPWADATGPVALFADKGEWYTHGTFMCRDSLLGPLYLVFTEVLEPDEPAASFLLNFHAELMLLNNVALSQPYYSRHPWVHLKRGEVKPFLKSYYTCVSALADRETYTFGEHLFPYTSPHKTHEEAWFLMETRWMLYMEQGDTLKLLPGIPRSWMEEGETIELKDAASYFGPFTLKTESKLQQGSISASVECRSERAPSLVEIRLPHPLGRKPKSVSGGVYDAETETVRIEAFSGFAEVEVYY